MKKNTIEDAFLDFEQGKRPKGYRSPKYWYVLNNNGEAYPVKAIWALATNQNLSSFNTTNARSGFKKLNYLLIDIRKISVNQTTFESNIKKAISDRSEIRKKRLSKAQKQPNIIYKLVKTYQRNADVVAEVLYRANGICEMCKKPAPFKKKKDLLPYLEVHHKKPLADKGEDTVKNAIALCPNCHRESHYG